MPFPRNYLLYCSLHPLSHDLPQDLLVSCAQMAAWRFSSKTTDIPAATAATTTTTIRVCAYGQPHTYQCPKIWCKTMCSLRQEEFRCQISTTSTLLCLYMNEYSVLWTQYKLCIATLRGVSPSNALGILLAWPKSAILRMPNSSMRMFSGRKSHIRIELQWMCLSASTRSEPKLWIARSGSVPSCLSNVLKSPPVQYSYWIDLFWEH